MKPMLLRHPYHQNQTQTLLLNLQKQLHRIIYRHHHQQQPHHQRRGKMRMNLMMNGKHGLNSLIHFAFLCVYRYDRIILKILTLKKDIFILISNHFCEYSCTIFLCRTFFNKIYIYHRNEILSCHMEEHVCFIS